MAENMTEDEVRGEIPLPYRTNVEEQSSRE